MSTNLRQEIDYNGLLETLLEKTRAGKLQWHETADENTFVAAVKGRFTFEINSNDQCSVQVLRMIDDGGTLILKETRSGDLTFKELHRLARRVAMQLDKNLESALDLLHSL